MFKNIKLFTGFLMLISLTIGVSGAEYSAPITVTNNPGQTGYQASINLAHQTGMNSDFSNIRFYDGEAQIPYWVQDSVSSTNATVWIPIDADSSITCRWGVAGETISESNGKQVFPLLFDDFDDNIINTTLWNTSTAGTVTLMEANGWLLLHANDGSIAVTGKTSYTNSMVYEQRVRIDNSHASARHRFIRPFNTAVVDAGIFENTNRVFFASTRNYYWTPGTTYKMTHIWVPSTSYTEVIGSLYTGSMTTNMVATVTPEMAVGEGSGSDTSYGNMSVDWTLIRKYAATAPTLTLGSVTQSPVAVFSANTTSGEVPLEVAFTDSSLYTPTSWLWNFGDGNTSTEQNPTHTYTVAGDYTVSLTVSNAAGSNAVTKTNHISVVAPAEPGGNFTVSLVGKNWNLVNPGAQPTLNFSSNAAFNSISFIVNGEPAGNLTGSWGAGETVSVNGPTLAAGGRFYNVSLVAKTGSSESNTISYRISTTREQAEDTPMEELDVSASDALQENLSSLNVTGSAATIMSPFTSNLGKSAYIILFVLPFVFLWRQGEGMTLPSVLVMLVGSLLIGLIPESYWEVGIVAIVCAFAYSLWSLSHQK